MTDEILVSICSLAYNHEKYIRQTLEGFVTQKTDFRFEVLVHDDASTDHTADIIREYADKYPDIIKPIYQTENQYSKNAEIITDIIFPLTKGKYIAFCECDDYWCDENKLQKQIDFLESHPDYSGAVHNVMFVDENDAFIELQFPECEEHDITTLDSYLNFPQTSSYVMRNPMRNQTDDIRIAASYLFSRDKSCVLYMMKTGKVRCFEDTMSHYRMVTNSGSSYSARKKRRNLTEELISVETRLYNQITAYGMNIDFSKHYFRKACAYSFMFLLRNPSKENFELHRKAVRSFPYSKIKYFKTMISYCFEKVRNRFKKA